VPPPNRRRLLLRVLLLGGSLALATAIAEGALRLAGGHRLLTVRLQPAAAGAQDAAAVLELAPDLTARVRDGCTEGRRDLDPAWLATSPPPPPRPPALGQPLRQQHDWLLHYYVTNAALLRATWVRGQGLPMFPGIALPAAFTVFDPPGGKPVPRYRYPASRTLPTGLVTNRFGFRGRDLAVDKPARTVRIGFVGASTTVEAHGMPHAAPELIEHWLSLWGARRHPSLRFETLNAAREAVLSPDLHAIVEDELLPLAVDYVVYYEGANQLQPPTMQKHVRVDGAYELAQPPPGVVGTFDETVAADTTWLDRLAPFSAMARYLRSALQRGERLAEPAKPAQEITLPPELRRGEFPLARAGEALELAAIGRDLDAIRAAAAARGAKLVLATFWWLAGDGLTVDPILGRNVFIHLNRTCWPFRYATVRELADVQNRFFAAWAAARGVDLADVAAGLPQDDRLAIDAIHQNELGVRLKAWVLFARLTEILERDLAAATVPVPDDHPDAGHPNIGPVGTLTPAELDAGR
jgi:hypothetical protein